MYESAVLKRARYSKMLVGEIFLWNNTVCRFHSYSIFLYLHKKRLKFDIFVIAYNFIWIEKFIK